MNRRAFLAATGKFLAGLAFPSATAWASLNPKEEWAFKRTHADSAQEPHRAFTLHPKVKKRVENWKKEIPYQFHRIYGTSLFRDFCQAEKVTGFSVADQLTIALLETAIGENAAQRKNIAEIEDETFVETFCALPASDIDSIAAYDRDLGRRARVLAPLRAQGRSVFKSVRKQILALRASPFVSMIVVARHILEEAGDIAQIARDKGCDPRFWKPESHFWTVHNSGGGMARQIVDKRNEPAAQLMGTHYLRRRGFPVEGSARDYHANAYGYYCEIRQAFRTLLKQSGFQAEDDRKTKNNNPPLDGQTARKKESLRADLRNP